MFLFDGCWCEYNLFLYVFDALIMKNIKTGINAGNVGNDKINDKRLITESF